MKIVRSGHEGPGYYPKQMGGETRDLLRSSLETMIVHARIPAQAATATAPAVPAVDIYNTMAICRIDGANIPGARLREARDCYRGLNNARNAQRCR